MAKVAPTSRQRISRGCALRVRVSSDEEQKTPNQA